MEVDIILEDTSARIRLCLIPQFSLRPSYQFLYLLSPRPPEVERKGEHAIVGQVLSFDG